MKALQGIREGMLLFAGLTAAMHLGALEGLAAEVRIDVDISKPGPEISPYIYGQFIEHLGRCIRDGVWAEKLRDRKFLLEPGKSWLVVKPQDAAADVFHDTAGAYAGDHALTIWVRDAKGGRCGIAQSGIGLLEGKEYVGYAILAHAAAPAPVEIRVAWGQRESDGQSFSLQNVGREYGRFPFRFRAGATTDTATLSLTMSSPGYLWAACSSLMPAENVRGMRPRHAGTDPQAQHAHHPLARR